VDSTTLSKMSASSWAAFFEGFGDRKGINRQDICPAMDERGRGCSRSGGRPALVTRSGEGAAGRDLQTELLTISRRLRASCGSEPACEGSLGRSNHHKIEAIFKCWHARCVTRHPPTRAQDQLLDQGVVVIAIFDYGAGNLRSVQNTLDESGAVRTRARCRGLERAPRSFCLALHSPDAARPR